jgi:hypothetical protein
MKYSNTIREDAQSIGVLFEFSPLAAMQLFDLIQKFPAQGLRSFAPNI